MCGEHPRLPKRTRFLSLREVAEELHISERSAWRLVEQGEVPVHRFGASTRVKREDLDNYVERCRRTPDESDEDDDGEPSPER